MEGILPSPAEAETEEEMFTMPTIDMVATGRNIMRLREATGLTVRDLQDIFGFATPQAIYKWQHGTVCKPFHQWYLAIAYSFASTSYYG